MNVKLLAPILGVWDTFMYNVVTWIEKFQWWKKDGGGDEEATESSESPSSLVECYACTQEGVPAFHSTTCDRVHPPEWESTAGSYLVRISEPRSKSNRKRSSTLKGPLGRVLDPWSKGVRRWNSVFLLARGMSLAIDPLFFYALSIGKDGTPCLTMDVVVAASVTLLRTLVDVVHIFYMCLQFRLAYVSKESLVIGCGKLVWDPSAIASHYVSSFEAFWFDALVILPIPQAVLWLVVPKLVREGKIQVTMIILLLVYLFQFLIKTYHITCIMIKGLQKVTGYIFGTIWWALAYNIIAYFMGAHVLGGCWYALAIHRIGSCVAKLCDGGKKCNATMFCGNNSTRPTGIPDGSTCLNINGPYRYGIYKETIPVVSSDSLAVKISYPIYWGMLNLSTLGNVIIPTSYWLEVIFSIIAVLSGMLLFTLLVGNIQLLLRAMSSKRRKMQWRRRILEGWMNRRQFPSHLRKRVRCYEHQRWVAMDEQDEMELIEGLPEGLRRDIKRYLSLDLLKKVPLFQHLDDLILDNICDRVRPLVFFKDEKIITEGDTVQKMVFVVHGQLQSSQTVNKGMVATSMLGPGSFFGDELLSWCLRRPFIDRLPLSSATFLCVKTTEAFGLEAKDLRFITDHFRYNFANEKLKRTARSYSSNWRTWAAVIIQLAWRRYKKRTRDSMIQGMEIHNGNSDALLMRYAAMFMAQRPHDHLE
ncbi:hypothetical protein NE237_020446 [Protea cynaroides]|uniref:Cyclic nucleotide-binding domain-containing protein n=1 Tax=Protea cynaroides TaxID=273540 RepID=A0A9Q0H8F1_9MAGN|nr:hypothetical protein NE237_020446 [Protea cynaroides]